MATARKISDYAALTTASEDDFIEIVDVSDTSMAPTGTNKKITLANLAAAVQAIAAGDSEFLITEG